jgi:hypothetical protein
MLTLWLFVILSQGRTGCKDQSQNESSPADCIETIIAEIEKKPVQNPPTIIWQFNYEGNVVYYIPAPCCDQFNPVYNTKCTLICHPDGGLTGKGDRKCDDFFVLAKNKRIIWKDSRGRE